VDGRSNAIIKNVRLRASLLTAVVRIFSHVCAGGSEGYSRNVRHVEKEECRAFHLRAFTRVACGRGSPELLYRLIEGIPTEKEGTGRWTVFVVASPSLRGLPRGGFFFRRRHRSPPPSPPPPPLLRTAAFRSADQRRATRLENESTPEMKIHRPAEQFIRRSS